MKILLLGKNGQVGWELQQTLRSLGELITLDRESTPCGDLGDLHGIAKTIRSLSPDVVVNAAAYTAVDKAESDMSLAALINQEAPAVMARECAAINALFIHYSTDYVFDGSGSTPWTEYDEPNPINHYGKTKLAGEQAIIEAECRHLIFRTSWVYGAHGNNFIKTILRLSRERETLNIVADQIGVPTGAVLLARITAQAIQMTLQQSNLCGLYHLTPNGVTSWYELANFVIAEARKLDEVLLIQKVTPIASTEYNTPATRPLNSKLNCEKLERTFSVVLPDWKIDVSSELKEILESI